MNDIADNGDASALIDFHTFKTCLGKTNKDTKVETYVADKSKGAADPIGKNQAGVVKESEANMIKYQGQAQTRNEQERVRKDEPGKSTAQRSSDGMLEHRLLNRCSKQTAPFK
jgi:hypothetical protein